MKNFTSLDYKLNNEFIERAEDNIVRILVFLFKPAFCFIYKKYDAYKKSSSHKKHTLMSSFMVKCATLSVLFVLGIVIAFGASFFVKNVNAQDNELLHKYYTSITVKPGDTLWSIADSYYAEGYDNHADYINEVMHINHLESSDEIVSGTSLVIPYYSDEIK